MVAVAWRRHRKPVCDVSAVRFKKGDVSCLTHRIGTLELIVECMVPIITGYTGLSGAIGQIASTIFSISNRGHGNCTDKDWT